MEVYPQWAAAEQSRFASLQVELLKLIRKELKIGPDELSDADVTALVKLLDDDDTGASVCVARKAAAAARGADMPRPVIARSRSRSSINRCARAAARRAAVRCGADDSGDDAPSPNLCCDATRRKGS